MEDLGNINITIREAVGGRGASGNVGGGPGPGMNPSQREIADAIAAVEASQKQAMASVQASQVQLKTVTTRRDPFERILSGQDIRSELMDFLRRPSFAAGTGLLREGMETRKVLSGLGRAGTVLGVGLLALGAVAGTVAGGLAIMRKASEHVAERIEQTWRYSAQTAGAMAERQILLMAETMSEINSNSAQYAATIRQQTVAMVSQAKFNAELSKTTSTISRISSRLQASLYDVGTTALRSGAAFTAAGTSGVAVQNTLTAYRILEAREKKTGLTPFQQMSVAFIRMTRGNTEAAILQSRYLTEIAKNTRRKKDPMDVANQWFQADIQALTGRTY